MNKKTIGDKDWNEPQSGVEPIRIGDPDWDPDWDPDPGSGLADIARFS